MHPREPCDVKAPNLQIIIFPLHLAVPKTIFVFVLAPPPPGAPGGVRSAIFLRTSEVCRPIPARIRGEDFICNFDFGLKRSVTLRQKEWLGKKTKNDFGLKRSRVQWTAEITKRIKRP